MSTLFRTETLSTCEPEDRPRILSPHAMPVLLEEGEQQRTAEWVEEHQTVVLPRFFVLDMQD